MNTAIKNALGFVTITSFCFTIAYCKKKKEKKIFMNTYEFDINERREVTQIFGDNSIKTVLDTKFAFIVRCDSAKGGNYYVVKFLYYLISSEPPGFENEKSKDSITPFNRSLDAFRDTKFEIMFNNSKVKIIKGYREFADKIDKLFFLFEKYKNRSAPSNSFNEIFMEKIFEKSFYQLPDSVVYDGRTWSQDEEIELLNKKIFFKSHANISGINKEIIDIKSRGKFVEDAYYIAEQKFELRGEYEGNIEYDNTIGLPRKIQYTLQMAGEIDKLKTNAIISVVDTYNLKSAPY